MSGLIYEQDSLTVGGWKFTKPKDLIILNFELTTTKYNCSFRLSDGSAGYTNAQDYIIRAMYYMVSTAPGSFYNLWLLYSDNEIGFSGTVVPTNEVDQSSPGNGTAIYIPNLVSNTPTFVYPNMTIPAGKYGGIRMNTGNTGNIWGQVFCELA